MRFSLWPFFLRAEGGVDVPEQDEMHARFYLDYVGDVTFHEKIAFFSIAFLRRNSRRYRMKRISELAPLRKEDNTRPTLANTSP